MGGGSHTFEGRWKEYVRGRAITSEQVILFHFVNSCARRLHNHGRVASGMWIAMRSMAGEQGITRNEDRVLSGQAGLLKTRIPLVELHLFGPIAAAVLATLWGIALSSVLIGRPYRVPRTSEVQAVWALTLISFIGNWGVWVAADKIP